MTTAADLTRERRRAQWVLVAGAALGSTAVIAATAVAVIAADDILGDTALVGAAAAAIIVGAAIGTSALAAIMARSGRRLGLVVGYALAVVGAVIAAWAVIEASIAALIVGTALIGFSNSSTQLSRYAAADMVPPERRPWAIGLVVWAATVAAIVGPNIVPAAASVAESFGAPELVGPFLLPVAFAGSAAIVTLVLLRPDPRELADTSESTVAPAEAKPASMGSILTRPAVATALTAMIVGQVVMVVIMSMTPLHMTAHGHGLDGVGIVLSGHLAGMFALAPVSGRIAQVIGDLPTIVLGVAVLAVASTMAALAPADGGVVLFIALFLLGYGWNLGFVAGSSLLTGGLAPWERTTMQGRTDTIVWSSSALATVLGGFVLAAAGFAALGFVGAAFLALPLLAVARWRGALAERVARPDAV